MIAILLLVSFAVLLTSHVSLVFGLLFRPPRWRALVALVPLLAPLAVYWGVQERMRGRVSIWVIAFGIYLASLVAGYAVQ